MEKILVLLLVTLAVAYAVPDPRGIIVNLFSEPHGHSVITRATGEGPFLSTWTTIKSKCCHRTSGLSLARCAPKASENSECSAKTLYGVYYKCPCERGLTCEADKSIVGSITNTNFGTCRDQGRSKECLQGVKPQGPCPRSGREGAPPVPLLPGRPPGASTSMS
ncbi:Colipase [Myotis davidii]|uniref:Colipase n=1 Tax=Myotis davidii TaxID=225400 RepID=L5M641_MYODS|nr:Colipase [Myotis davidii]